MSVDNGKKDDEMIKELATLMQASGMLNNPNQSQLLVKVLLSVIALLIAMLIWVVEPGIKNIITNQEETLNITRGLKYQVDDHERRLTKAGL